VSDNVSTQLPTPPELQPLTSRTRFWSIASYFLITMGLIFLGWGSWGYFQNWYEVQNPPARIVESGPNNTGSELADDVAAATATPTATATVAPTATTIPPTATPEVEEALPTAIPPAEAESGSSLADNPLMVETSAKQTPAAAPPADPQTINMTRIMADSINLDSPVVDVGWEKASQNGQTVNVWTVAEYAAGWHKNSMLPGQGGNIVLSGHHNIKGEVFRYLVDLEPGAVISVYDQNDQQYDYAVFDKFILKDKDQPEEVRLANARWIGPFNEERLTLVTCWPYNSNSHRVIVIAKPIKTDDRAEADENSE